MILRVGGSLLPLADEHRNGEPEDQPVCTGELKAVLRWMSPGEKLKPKGDLILLQKAG